MAQMLGDAPPEQPVLFIKPPSVLRSASQMGEQLNVMLPPDAGEVHHECEIVLRLAKGAIDSVWRRLGKRSEK